MTNEIAAESQTSDPYDGTLSFLEARVETHRAQEAASDALAALVKDPGLVAVAPMGPHASGGVSDSGCFGRTSAKRHCPDCATGLLRIIRNSDDTVRHVNGEKCKRFHAA